MRVHRQLPRTATLVLAGILLAGCDAATSPAASAPAKPAAAGQAAANQHPAALQQPAANAPAAAPAQQSRATGLSPAGSGGGTPKTQQTIPGPGGLVGCGPAGSACPPG